jgi:hypothetical protein
MHYEQRVGNWHGEVVADREWLVCDSTRQAFSAFRVGEVTYRSNKVLRASFVPPFPGTEGRFVVDGLQDLEVGYGNTLDTARRDWELRVDMRIQRLLATQDFEQTSSEKKDLETLNRYFDLSKVRYASLLKVRAVGKLVAVYPRPWKVRWIDGTSSTLIREQLPIELVRMSVGRKFEAVVERDPRDWSLVRILSAFPCQISDEPDAVSAEAILSSIPTTGKLPDLEWD